MLDCVNSLATALGSGVGKEVLVCGTKDYIAPEVHSACLLCLLWCNMLRLLLATATPQVMTATHSPQYSTCSDLFSVGALLFRLTVGRAPPRLQPSYELDTAAALKQCVGFGYRCTVVCKE